MGVGYSDMHPDASGYHGEYHVIDVKSNQIMLEDLGFQALRGHVVANAVLELQR